METIYTVTVFQKISPNQLDLYQIVDLGDRRCVGWYDNIDEAKNAVINNFSDMHEDMYKFAIIEEVTQGIKIPDVSRVVFAWNANTNEYEEINLPKELEDLCSLGIG